MAPLTVKAYAGGGAALLAFDVDEATRKDLAGFAVQCQPPRHHAHLLTHRLIVPHPQTIAFATAPFKARYEWLGFGARKLVFDFLGEAVAGGDEVELALFASDLNEPDFVRGLVKPGKRLRMFLDNSASHKEPTD